MFTDWVEVTREDGETVGWLEPLDPEYALLRPRDVLGHVAGPDAEWVPAEECLVELGLAHVAEAWHLDGGPLDLSILEVSAAGIVVGDRLKTKALVDTGRIVVAWPDTEGRLSPGGSRASA